MSYVLAMPLLLPVACCAAIWAARRASPKAFLPLFMLCGMVCTVVLLGGLIAAAEAGRNIARYVGLAALLLAATSLVGAFMGLERLTAASPQARDE